MIGVPADQLPADVRSRLGLTGSGRRAPRTTRREVGGPLEVECHTCHTHFTATSGPNGYEHHQETTGHARYDCVLTKASR